MSDAPKFSEDQKFVRQYVLQVIAVFAVVVGGFAFLYEDYKHVKRQKIQASLEMIGHYTSSSVTTSRERLFQYWISNPFISESLSSNKGDPDNSPPSEAINAFFVQRLSSATDTLSSDLYVVVDFFDELLFCMESDTCDLEVSRDYFCVRAAWMHRTYQSALDAMRQLSQDFEYGTSISTILDIHCTLEE